MITDEMVKRVLRTVAGRDVAVLGDLMLDDWIIGDAARISPEAPVPVLDFVRRETAPGGAANVAMNLQSLGAQVHLVGIVGDDESGKLLCGELEQAGVNIQGVVIDSSRNTTQKTRIVARHQQMIRVDKESKQPLSPEIAQKLQRQLKQILEQAAILCISDYDKCIARGELAQWAISYAHERNVRVTSGPKPQNLTAFRGVDFASFNQKEAAAAAQENLNSDQILQRAGMRLREQYQLQSLAVTLGGRGAMLFEADKEPALIPGHTVEVFDVAGAGDTFLVAATLGILAEQDNVTACALGNLAAAASVRRTGVVTVHAADLLEIR